MRGKRGFLTGLVILLVFGIFAFQGVDIEAYAKETTSKWTVTTSKKTYAYTGKKIKIFAVGADYDVYEDTKYFSEGIIYNFLILEEQNGQWRVNTLMQIADPSLLKMKGYHFQSDYNITENIMEARENGYLVNGKGKVFSDINEKEIDGS